MRGRILAVDDDEAILGVVRLNLEAEGFAVDCADCAEAGRARFEPGAHSLAILDVMLPDGDGFELARLIRARSNIPIMFLSARDTDVDKAVGLGIGGDDYLTKPFSPVELVARVKAHLRRYEGAEAMRDAIEAGQVRLDLAGRRATVRGAEIELTAKEFDLLRLLAERPGRVYTKAQIFEQVWGEEPFGDLSTVVVHVRRLRAKIEESPEEPKLVETVWGIGYRFGLA